MVKLTRREVLKIGMISGGLMAGLSNAASGALSGEVDLARNGKDFSPITGEERLKIPSACDQCHSRDGIVGYVENGRVVKIEGNPELSRTNGKICSKGQAGLLKAYSPDRLLHPMKRVGKRGEGKWKRISWDDALDEIVERLQAVRDSGHPEKFCFQNGRMTGSSGKVIKKYILPGLGTNTFSERTSLCGSGRWVAQELMWGDHYSNDDLLNANFILNFGANFFECHTNHIPLAQRMVKALADNKTRLVTLDVRFSNTAAKSDEWIPILPGGDGPVVHAMIHTLLKEGLYDEDFIETWSTTTIEKMKKHWEPYTPAWAEELSGVKASRIRSLALEFANAKPAACFEYKGAVAHYGGTETGRALMTLNALCGYIDVKGGRRIPVKPKWKSSFKPPDVRARKLGFVDGREDVAFPIYQTASQVFSGIKDGSKGRPEVMMIFMYNPAYTLFDNNEVVDVLMDEELVPFTIVSDINYTETAHLADIILPDAVYLERWDYEAMISMIGVEEYYIRQPMVEPAGEARDFRDVLIEISKMLGVDPGFDSMEEFVRDACQSTGPVKNAGGFEYMIKHGAWYDKNPKIRDKNYEKLVPPEVYTGKDILFDEETGVFWNWKKSRAKSREEAISKGYTETERAFKGYVGQKIGDKVCKGFQPRQCNKSGKFEIHSRLLEKKGYHPLPTYMPIHDFKIMEATELHLVSFRINTQCNSRTQQDKWLTEIQHRNPAWIHPEAAGKRDIKHGDRIVIKSEIGEIVTTAHVTEGIHPRVVAMSHHHGHWQSGYFAADVKSPRQDQTDVDGEDKWWKEKGVHPNWIMKDAVCPISGQHAQNDCVVSVRRA